MLRRARTWRGCAGTDAVLTVRGSKFGRSLLVPLYPTTTNHLRDNARRRDEPLPRPIPREFAIAEVLSWGNPRTEVFSCAISRHWFLAAGVGREALGEPDDEVAQFIGALDDERTVE